jgi:hypothetical protein
VINRIRKFIGDKSHKDFWFPKSASDVDNLPELPFEFRENVWCPILGDGQVIVIQSQDGIMLTEAIVANSQWWKRKTLLQVIPNITPAI